MLPDALDLRPFDPQTASDAKFAALHALEATLHNESGQRPNSLAAFTQSMRVGWSGRRTQHWALWRGVEAMGMANLNASAVAENVHTASFWIGVTTGLRRQDLGKALLRQISDLAQETEQSELICWTSSLVPASGIFLQRLGAHVFVEHLESALDLDTFDGEVMREWLKRGESLASEFELVTLEGAWPDADLDAACAMYDIMNTAPHNANIEDWHTTPELIRTREAYQAASHWQRWTLYIRPITSREIAGYTEVYWRPDDPEVLSQNDTAIASEYRGRGLAIWLKAAMLDKVLHGRPSVKRIETGNASINEAMLSINNRLGFKTTHSNFMWQMTLADVQAYLAERG